MHKQICQHCDSSFNQDDMHPCGESSIWFCHGCWLIFNNIIMKKAEETVGVGKQLVSFGEAIKGLKEGKRVQRLGWNGKGLFVFEQVPSSVNASIVPEMTSLPQSVKDEFNRRFSSMPDDADIRYRNQLALVKPTNEINGWNPSTEDSLANDWIILD
jgi:hypothetical protein